MPEITIQSRDGGKFMAYVAAPPGGRGAALVLIQEIFGVNRVMRDLADGFARHGHICVCPDLFWRQEPGIQITDKTDAEWAKAFELFKGFDQDKGVEDLKATLAHARTLQGSTGKAGTVGYCLGGNLAYRMACKSDADANVSYYGVGIEGLLDQAKGIVKPLLMHVAEEDKFVPKEAQAAILAALKPNRHVTIHAYPGCDHAFARLGGQHWNKDAAELANKRTAEFLKRHLG